MVAIVTIMGIGGAFAMSPPKSQVLQTWGVISTSANSYNVTAVTANSLCNSPAIPACEVRSAATPDASGNIPKSGATVVSRGSFQK